MNKKLVLLTWGGIGDLIICTPTIEALKRIDPKRKIIVYCSRKIEADVLCNNPYIDSLRVLNFWQLLRCPYHLFAFYFNRKLVPYTQFLFQHISPTHIYNTSIKNIVADIFGIKLEQEKVRLYLTEKEKEKARKALEPFKYVVLMHINSRASVNHHWPIERWNELVLSLPEFSFIQIGMVDEEYIQGAIDWRGKTSIREVFALMYYATSFVGVDSSMSHVTNAFDIPGVVLFGDSSPTIWGHENNLNIHKKVACSPCYYYLWRTPCPYDHECMHLITVEEVKMALKEQVEKGTERISRLIK